MTTASAPSLEQLISELAHGPAPDEAGCVCAPEGDGWRLRIWGSLDPDWAGNLSLQCYAARLDIVDGEACRVRERLWAGSFRLVAEGGAAPPDGFDFLQMARRRPSLPLLQAPEIASLAIERDPGEPVARVSITGRDQLGFLAHVLGAIAASGLEPQHLVLRTTTDGMAADRFIVAGEGETPATDAALADLRRRLGR